MREPAKVISAKGDFMGSTSQAAVLQYAQWRKACSAKKPTPEQAKLLELWLKIEAKLDGYDTDNISPLDLDNEMELLHVSLEDGRVWLTVTEHRNVDIPLDDLCSDGKQLALIMDEIQQLAGRKRRKPVGNA
jgi:hypothetical protein